MIHFIPDRFVPEKYQGEEGRYWNECVSLGILFIFGLVFSRISDQIETSVIAEYWQKFRNYIHRDAMCPLCGGTRSFLAMCRGDILSALHYSFFGTFVFFAMIFHLLLKISLLVFKNVCRLRLLANIADEYVTLFTVMFSLWGLQLLLHYYDIFSWYVIKP